MVRYSQCKTLLFWTLPYYASATFGAILSAVYGTSLVSTLIEIKHMHLRDKIDK